MKKLIINKKILHNLLLWHVTKFLKSEIAFVVFESQLSSDFSLGSEF